MVGIWRGHGTLYINQGSWVAFRQVTDDDDGDDVAIASKSTDLLLIGD